VYIYTIYIYTYMPLKIYCRIREGSYDNVVQRENICDIAIKYGKKNNTFTINKLWKPETTNEDIFEELYSNTNGYHVNYWVAFGYTGSGKTYTTNSLIRNLYSTLQVDKKCRLQISAIQIYNDSIYDLFNKNTQLSFYKTNNLVIKNITKLSNQNIDELLDMMSRNRNTAQTEMNNTSSRSHAIITIYYNKLKYIIVDMAGQETVSTDNKNAILRKQANHINLNMLALKECIRSTNDKKQYIPYRRTLLTLALKPIFEDNCNVSFICNVNLKQKLYYQIDSMRYASSLYRKMTISEDHFIQMFTMYTKYIQDEGWYSCQERMLWNEFKNGKSTNVKSIEGLISKKTKCTEELNKQIQIYKNKIS